MLRKTLFQAVLAVSGLLVLVSANAQNQDESRSVSGQTYMTILDMVLDAKCGDESDKNCK